MRCVGVARAEKAARGTRRAIFLGRGGMDDRVGTGSYGTAGMDVDTGVAKYGVAAGGKGAASVGTVRRSRCRRTRWERGPAEPNGEQKSEVGGETAPAWSTIR